MRRIVTMLLAAAMALIGTVLVAGPASAHHSSVSGTIACGPQSGTWVITWRVQNWNDPAATNTATVTSSSRGVVPVGTTFTPNQTKTFTETVSSTSTVSLNVSMRWTNGVTSTNSGSVSGFPTCTESVTPTAPSVTPPTCDTAGTLQVPAATTKVSYAVSPSYDGPGTYTVTATAKPGYTISGTSTWTVTVDPKKTGEECWKAVTPVAPSVTPIRACDTIGQIEFASTEGIVYELVEGDGTSGPWKVTATPMPGYRFTEGATTEWSGDLGDLMTCATPVAPTAASISGCDLLGAVSFATTQGIVYTLTEGDGVSGLWKVVATALPGFEIPEGVPTVFTGDLGSLRTCATPVEPTTVAATCETGETIDLPTTEGVAYEATPGENGTVIVTATPLDGFELVGTSEWTIQLADADDCVGGVVEEEPPTSENPVTPVGDVDAESAEALPATGMDASLVLMALMGIAVLAAGLVTVARSQRG